ncbi:MAG: ribonuclease P [Thermoplasmata archaeon]|nr:ribonuclease P [Thermoplasmata archaeon]MCJ7562542.1 ribonuclease P [Thermoplasmata archaeon]TFG68754.1 MAG: ribonuclease P [Methanomassiliicoccus sp.]
MARRHLSRSDARDIAEERVDRLFELAEKEGVAGNDERARRYVGLALKMNERHKVRARHKRKYCPECHVYFTPPRNVRVRTRSGNVAMTCLSCGNVLRYPLKPKKVEGA